MNKDIILDTNNLYYLTVVNSEGKKESILVAACKNGFYDVNSSDFYVASTKREANNWFKFYENKFEEGYTLSNPVPFNVVVNDALEKCSLKSILEKDSYVEKKLSDKGIFAYNNTKEYQETLTIIKPDGVSHLDEIIEMISAAGLKIEQFKASKLDDEILDEHYSHLIDKSFYPSLKEYMMSSPVFIMILSGENAVEKLRNLMGPTDSTKAGKDTIRGRFGTDIQKNAIHGSDSKESAEIEINRFFKTKQKNIK